MRKYIFINILITARYFYYKNWWATIPFEFIFLSKFADLI